MTFDPWGSNIDNSFLLKIYETLIHLTFGYLFFLRPAYENRDEITGGKRLSVYLSFFFASVKWFEYYSLTYLFKFEFSHDWSSNGPWLAIELAESDLLFVLFYIIFDIPQKN